MRRVIFLPGIIAPAAIRYAPLLARLPDVDPVTKDLEVYATETLPPGYSIAVDEPAYDFTDAAREDMREFGPLAALPVPERMRAFMRLQVSPAVSLPAPPDGPTPPWMARRPAGIDAFIAALDRHERLDERYSTFHAPVLFTWGSLTHPRWDQMRLRLATAFPDFIAERFDGLHHLNTSHQAEPDRVAGLLRDLWTRAELAV